MRSVTSPTRLLSSRKAAEYCGYSLVRWQQLVRTRRIPFAVVGRSYLFAQADLDDYIKRHQKAPGNRGRKPWAAPAIGREETAADGPTVD